MSLLAVKTLHVVEDKNKEIHFSVIKQENLQKHRLLQLKSGRNTTPFHQVESPQVRQPEGARCYLYRGLSVKIPGGVHASSDQLASLLASSDHNKTHLKGKC